jgi:hypothetical protein
MEWFVKLNEKLPTEILFQIMRYQGGCLPAPSNKKMIILQKHFSKRYCKYCGEYKILYGSHRHHPRKKYYEFVPKYKQVLKIREMLFISKTNFKFHLSTPSDIIVVWEDVKPFYFSFRRCLQNNKYDRLEYHRDMYFTDIGILSNVIFWYVEEWNRTYPKMKYDIHTDRFIFKEPDILWTPHLANSF